jgi:nifR3 family TIM-barrel protein
MRSDLSGGFEIGPVRVPNRLVLAPMAGVTDVIFRAFCEHLGAGLVFTEMVSSLGLIYSNRQSQGILEIAPDEHPVGVQIFGSSPEAMARAALLVRDAGPDFIDINMGCPVPKVVKNREGCALMLEPLRAQEIIKAVRQASGLPVTVKMRKGWDEEKTNAVEFALACQEAGVAALTVHGRTRAQFYSGKADWAIIARVKEIVRVPVIGNGDVWRAEDVLSMLDLTGCDAVMIARGCLGNPWIFEQAAGLLSGKTVAMPGAGDRIRMALLHLNLVVARTGERAGVPSMRKHIAWYLKGLPGHARVRDAINTARSAADVERVLLEFEGSFGESAR